MNHRDDTVFLPIYKEIRVKTERKIFTERLIKMLLEKDLAGQKRILRNKFVHLNIKGLNEAAHEQPSSFSALTKLKLEEFCRFDDSLDTYDEPAHSNSEELIPDTLPSPDTDPKRLTQS